MTEAYYIMQYEIVFTVEGESQQCLVCSKLFG